MGHESYPALIRRLNKCPALRFISDWYMFEPRCIDVALALIEMQDASGEIRQIQLCHSLATMASLKIFFLHDLF